MITIGQRIGEYVISEKLGRGGFGEVWLAQRDGKPFAIKFAVGQQIDWKAIAQEIGLWVLCGRHPNILQLIEARNFDGQIALISEYAADGSLDQLIKTTSGLDELKAVSIAIEILNGLDHLHSKGIIHRDLKPANVLLHGEQARIADFGISRIISSETSSETISGTFAYMAPECFDGKRNAQTDIWSVGIILFQMLTGDLPFKGKEPTATIASIIMNYVDPIEEIECLLEGDVDVSSRNRLTQILTPYLGFTYRIFRERWARSQDLNFEHEVNRTIDHFANEYRFSREQLSNLESFVWSVYHDIEVGSLKIDELVSRYYCECKGNIRTDLFKLLSPALRKDPTKRYKSAREMLSKLQAWYDDANLLKMNELRNAARIGINGPSVSARRAGQIDPPKNKSATRSDQSD